MFSHTKTHFRMLHPLDVRYKETEWENLLGGKVMDWPKYACTYVVHRSSTYRVVQLKNGRFFRKCMTDDTNNTKIEIPIFGAIIWAERMLNIWWRLRWSTWFCLRSKLQELCIWEHREGAWQTQSPAPPHPQNSVGIPENSRANADRQAPEGVWRDSGQKWRPHEVLRLGN